MNNIIKTIITGIIATAIYEIAKYIIIFITDRVKEKSKEFSISGIWCTYHESRSSIDNQLFSAYELIKLKYNHGKIIMNLYQLTNDGRKYHYKGYGCLRGNKLTIAYEEASNKVSNHTGVIILKLQNIVEHSIFLQGNYAEFRGNNEESTLYPYFLKPHKISLKNKIKIFLFKTQYIYKYMSKEDFKNDTQRMY